MDAIVDVVQQMGITRDWDRARFGLSFAIGAGEMRLIDMASAYQVVANMGVRVEPTMIMKIIDRNGKVVRDYTKPEGKQVLDPKLAWIMSDILKDNTDPNGSFVFGPLTNIGRPAALKTGTTDNLQDVLAIGYTPQRLTAVWMGNSDTPRCAASAPPSGRERCGANMRPSSAGRSRGIRSPRHRDRDGTTVVSAVRLRRAPGRMLRNRPHSSSRRHARRRTEPVYTLVRHQPEARSPTAGRLHKGPERGLWCAFDGR